MKHISDINLQRLLDGTLSVVRRILATRHLDGCEACRARLEEIKARRQELLGIARDMKRLQEAEDALAKTSILRK